MQNIETKEIWQECNAAPAGTYVCTCTSTYIFYLVYLLAEFTECMACSSLDFVIISKQKFPFCYGKCMRCLIILCLNVRACISITPSSRRQRYTNLY